jgi:chorismate mutase
MPERYGARCSAVSSAATMSDELSALRAAIDVCNTRLAAVLHERAALARAAAAWKQARGLPVADPAREAAMLARIGELGGMGWLSGTGGFDVPALQRIFAVVFAETRALGEGAAGAGTAQGG